MELSVPLTNLLKKNAFQWSDDAQIAFNKLKEAMSSAPVLKLHDFTKEFVIETDASGYGLGVVLMQGGHPLAYISKHLASKHMSLSAYEKELMAMVLAVEKWKPYLAGRHFVIKTYHFSLKYILGQKISTPFQSKWLPKLLGLDYDILFKKEKENIVADALSRINHTSIMEITVSYINSELLSKVQESCHRDSHLQSIIDQL